MTVTTRNGTMNAGGFVGEGYDTQYCYCLGDLTVLIEKGKISAGGFVGKGAAIEHSYAYGNLDAKLADGKVVTAGGRVLGVVATADTLKEAIDKAYAEVENVTFDNAFYRRDIGQRALKALG